MCDFVTKIKGSLKVHITSIHDGIKYGCDQCEYKATKPGNLKRHIQAMHGENCEEVVNKDVQLRTRIVEHAEALYSVVEFTQTRFSSRGFLSLFCLIDLSCNLSLENLG